MDLPIFNAVTLSQLLDALEANYGTNFPAALLVLGSYILAIHYICLDCYLQQSHCHSGLW